MIGPLTSMQSTFAYVRSLYEVEDEEVEAPAVVTATVDNADPATLPASARTLLKKVALLKWNVAQQRTTEVHTAAVTFKANGVKPKADGTLTLKGDPKSPAKDVRHTFLAVADPSGKVGFRVAWEGTKFNGAIVKDPFGIPVELFTDYTPSAATKKQLGEVRATELAEHSDAAYNDGTMVLSHKKLMPTATEFGEWVDLWLKMTGHEVKAKAPRKVKVVPVAADVLAADDAALMAGADWVAE